MPRIARRSGWLILAIFAVGCASTPTKVTDRGKPESPYAFSFSKITAPLRPSYWRKGQPVAKEFPSWDWAPALPRNVQRGDLVEAKIERGTLARFAPDIPADPIVLVSGVGPSSAARIVNVAGHKVEHFADLSIALDRTFESSQPVQVDFELVGVSGDPQVVAAQIENRQLVELCQHVAPDAKSMRVAEDGNPWVVLRDGAVQCKLTARVERNHGLLHVVVSLLNTTGQEMLLPTDVRATHNGRPLRCLNTADVLQVLYGDPSAGKRSPTEEPPTFATLAEREDFLVPLNFKELDRRLAELYETSASGLPTPALASVEDEAYPGPALLCDARALTLFMLQPQRVKPGDKELTGWVLFAGEDLRSGGILELEIQLPSGSHRVQLSLPN